MLVSKGPVRLGVVLPIERKNTGSLWDESVTIVVIGLRFMRNTFSTLAHIQLEGDLVNDYQLEQENANGRPP
jgi:hypothetical protein